MKAIFMFLWLPITFIGVFDFFTKQVLTTNVDTALMVYPLGFYFILFYRWHETMFWHRLDEVMMYIFGLWLFLGFGDYTTFQLLGKDIDKSIILHSFTAGILYCFTKRTLLMDFFKHEEVEIEKTFFKHILQNDNCDISIRWTPSVKCVVVKTPVSNVQSIKDKITLAFRDAGFAPYDHIVEASWTS